MVIVAESAPGSLILPLLEAVHPLASVIVAVYVAAATPVMLAVVALLLHTKLYGVVPPEPLAVAPPSEKPLQVTVLELSDL